MIFDYDAVKLLLNDHDTFSSQVPAPKYWFVFSDPPNHTKLRALISQAFTPRVVANLEPRIRALSRQLLDQVAGRGEFDLAADYSIPLPMKVIAGMIGIPSEEWPRFRRWSDAILLSHTMRQSEEAAASLARFRSVSLEMNTFLSEMIDQRRVPRPTTF